MAKKVLVTGGAGFIGSNLCEKLLELPEVDLVRVMDNFATGSKQNIDEFLSKRKFVFIESDIRDFDECKRACSGMDVILHQAALGSVPRSVSNPIVSNQFNIDGTLNIFFAAKESGVKKLAFASSSSTYGDNKDSPKKEDNTGQPLSPYAVTKKVGELYAKVFADLYDFHYMGFRYFNVFGPRQSAKGAYAAVIPIFFRKMMNGISPIINGSGEQSRDFTFVQNVVDANLGTIFNNNPESWNNIYNIACGHKTSLKELYHCIADLTGFTGAPVFGPDRQGDIRDSLADISKATQCLGYNPKFNIEQGLQKTHHWYKDNPAYLEE